MGTCWVRGASNCEGKSLTVNISLLVWHPTVPGVSKTSLLTVNALNTSAFSLIFYYNNILQGQFIEVCDSNSQIKVFSLGSEDN